jgi:hypothetical protein
MIIDFDFSTKKKESKVHVGLNIWGYGILMTTAFH